MSGTKSSSSEAWRMIRSYAVAGTHDSSVINRMMLRFRPIAPKPTMCPDVPGGVSAGEKNSSVFPNGRRKRKYVRVRRNSGYTRKKSQKVTKPINDDVLKEVEENGSATLLQLLPERSCDLNRPIDLDLAKSSSDDHSAAKDRAPHTWSIWERPRGSEVGSNKVLVVHGLVTVESVAEMNDDEDQSTDAERVMSLDRDTCPGFVSDGSDRVVWVNGAFKRIVMKQETEEDVELEVVVGLVIKERFPPFYSAFTGHVKLQFHASSGAESERYSRVVPFDLWRMDGGGFAWRLDVEAALTLGRT